MLATQMLITLGSKASRPAKLRPQQQTQHRPSQRQQAQYHPTQRQSMPYVRAASTRDLAYAVVALTVVLGPGNVAVLATQLLITLGSRAYRPAKIRPQQHPQHRPSQRQQASHVPSASRTPVNAVVAFAVVLGSGTVAIPTTQHLTTHGPKGPKSAKVSSQLIQCENMCVQFQ